MRTGPTIQLRARDRRRSLVFRNTAPSASYLTLASGGYIMTMRPRAMGRLVAPA